MLKATLKWMMQNWKILWAKVLKIGDYIGNRPASPASSLRPRDPTLRAIFFLEVTDQFWRLPLPTLFSLNQTLQLENNQRHLG